MYLSRPEVGYESSKNSAWIRSGEDLLVLRVVKGKGRRRIKAALQDGEVVLTIPQRCSRQGVLNALHDLGGDLVKAAKKWKEVERSRKESPITFWGEPLPIEWSQGGEPGAVLSCGTLKVTGASSQAEADEAAARWLARESMKELPLLVQAQAARMGIGISRVTVRDQKSRWGSCSSRGVISINWRLVMAPREVAEYLVIHELCHRKEMNHGPRYWALVEQWCTDYRAWERWLRKEGPRLMTRLPRLSLSTVKPGKKAASQSSAQPDLHPQLRLEMEN